jgi:hypothetical protein
LGTPPKHAAARCNPVQEQEAHDASTAGLSGTASISQQDEQQQERHEICSAQKGVHWLPGLQAAGALVPAAPATGLNAKARPTVPSALGGLAATTGAGSLGSADDAAGQQDAASSDGRSKSSSSRAGPLPASDDQQLDNYLRYLLQEQHPHKFLYYVGWSLTCEGESCRLQNLL